MPTVGVPDGSLLKIRMGTTPVAVACMTEASFEVQHDLRDTTCKDSGAYNSYAPGMINSTLSGSGHWKFDAAAGANPAQFLTSIVGRTQLDWNIGTGVTGDPIYSGKCYPTSFSFSGGNADSNIGYEFSLQVDGPITIGTTP